MRSTIKQGNPDILLYHNKATAIDKQVFYGYHLHADKQDMISAMQKDSYRDQGTVDGIQKGPAELASLFQIAAAGGTVGDGVVADYDTFELGVTTFSLKYLFWTRTNIGAPDRPYSDAQLIMNEHPSIDRK